MNLYDYFKCDNETPFVDHIVKALRENIIGEPEEKHKSFNITMLCLFSGQTPTCEYYICKKLKELYIFKTMNVILIDIYCPAPLINTAIVKIHKEGLKKKFNIDDITCYNFADFNNLLKPNELQNNLILDENTYCFALNPQHNDKPPEGTPYGNPSDKIFPDHPSYNIYLGMYEFFNTYWLNRSVLYAFRGNPPPIVIFCPTVDKPYEGLTKLYSLTYKNFNINKVFTMNNNNKVLKNETGKYKSNIVNLCLSSISGGSKNKNIKKKTLKTKTKKKIRKYINLHKSKKYRKYKNHYYFI